MEPKVLPPAKISPAKLLGGSSLSTTVKKISAKSVASGDQSLELGVIKKQVISINNLVKTNTLLKAKEEERKRKLAEQKRFGERERKLEEPKDKENKISKLPVLPKLGFLERIKSFLFNIFLGYISLRLLPYLPKLAGVVGTIVKVQDTIIDWSGKILNGLVSFVDKAYEVHDKTRKFLGDLGGESFTKTFDGFIGAMDKVIEASIIAAIAFKELGDVGGGPSSSRSVDPRVARRYAERYGKGAAIREFGEEGVRSLGGKYARSGVTNLARRGLVGALGRGGTKTALRIVRPLVKNIPLIGGIMEFVLSWMSGDSVGKAAFRGVGGGLGTWVGGALGALIGGPIGAGIGMWLGSEGGAALGGLLYDKIFNNKDPKQQKVQGRAEGGPITRSGRLEGPAKRTVQKPKPKRTLKVQTTEVKPGQSVGGKKVIEKVFPDVEAREKGKLVNPLGYMKSSYKIGSSTPGFGGLDAIFMKARLGEKPSGTDYQRAADGLSAWMQRVYGTGIQRTGAFAEGGKVDVSMFNDDIGMKNMLAKALQDTITPKVDEMINDLKKQLGLKKMQVEKQKNISPDQTGVEGPEDFSGSTGAEKTMHYLISQGLTGFQAAGIAGNLQQESGFNPKADNGTHYGIAQWDKQNRWPRVSAYISSVGRDPNTLEGQLVGLKWEAEQRGDWKAIKGASSARDASAIWLERFERSGEKPGMPGFENRMSFANDLFAKYGSYKPSVGGGKGMDGYITGDPSNPNYDPSHGGGNYHDHLSFRDRSTAERAYRFFTSKGFKVTEFMGYGAGVTGPHSGPGSLHHKGLAFDIPGSQVPVGQETKMSARVRAALSEFKSLKMVRGGKVKGRRGIDQVRAMLTHGEFVLDVDSTASLEKNFPGFLDALNKANYDGAIKVLRSYAEYEQGATIHATVEEKLIPVPIPIPSPQQPPVIMSSGIGVIDDSMSFNYTR